jgi:hypothetical protein
MPSASRTRAWFGRQLGAALLTAMFAGCSDAAQEPAAAPPRVATPRGEAGAAQAGAPAAGASEAGAAEDGTSANEPAAGGTGAKPRATGGAGKSTTGSKSTSPATTSSGTSGAGSSLPSSCDGDTQAPANDLVCTGIYADIVAKVVAPGVEAYAPAVPLWSDGAQKERWISLPVGETIDNSDPSEWVFPLGTKVWKEFSRGGRRVETRMWQKVDTNYWVAATYAWNADESAAARSAGGDFQLPDGSNYHIPTPNECQECHRGRTDRLLGFEQVLLGLAGATGYNLERLSADGRLTHPPDSSELTIGDDGTGLAAPALAWLHVNCGTTCHNRNSNATAWSTGMFLRLDPTELDGRNVDDFDPLKTTIGIPAITPAWQGRTRIVAGDPAHSLLFDLITHRGTGQQMPPIATNLVDEADVPLVEAWITQLPPVANGGTGGIGGRAGAGGRGNAGAGYAGGGVSNGGLGNATAGVSNGGFGNATAGVPNGGVSNGGFGNATAGVPNGGFGNSSGGNSESSNGGTGGNSNAGGLANDGNGGNDPVSGGGQDFVAGGMSGDGNATDTGGSP